MLIECNCTSAGFGAYPEELKSRPGQGPSKEIAWELKENPQNLKYDFKTIEGTDFSGVVKCLTVVRCVVWFDTANKTIQSIFELKPRNDALCGSGPRRVPTRDKTTVLVGC